MQKSEVLKIIDEVMNNREIDSIRNAILAIRDKVIEAPETDKQIIKAKWEDDEQSDFVRCSNCWCGLPKKERFEDYPTMMIEEDNSFSDLISRVNYCPFCGSEMRW